MMAMQLAMADVTPNPVIATRTRRLVEGWVRYEPWVKLRGDGSNAIQRFIDYEKYVDWVEASYPNTGAETQEPTRDLELIELGIRPDQWPEYQKKLMDGLNKMIEEESNVKER